MSISPSQLPVGAAGRKPFWKRPEGVTGAIFLIGILVAVGFLLTLIPWVTILQNAAALAALIALVGGLLYVIFDPKMRQLIWYAYRSAMRSITGVFVKIDPIGILKSYVEDLEGNLRKMNAQINKLRGQMHKLDEIIKSNEREIENNMRLASQARAHEKANVFTLKTRRAGRLKESNMRLNDLYRKMEVLYRVLDKMYRNGEILVEDVRDQVVIKEQERKAIRASHSAMQSAASVISSDKEQRYMYDQALEAIADDVSMKVGEMERFMEMSSTFMDSIDLQNGVFEEKGLELLERWEMEGDSILLGKGEKQHLIEQANDEGDVLDLNARLPEPERAQRSIGGNNQYDKFFD